MYNLNDEEYDAYIRDLYKESSTGWWKCLLIALVIGLSVYVYIQPEGDKYNEEYAKHIEYVKLHPQKPKPVKKQNDNQQVEQSSIY